MEEEEEVTDGYLFQHLYKSVEDDRKAPPEVDDQGKKASYVRKS